MFVPKGEIKNIPPLVVRRQAIIWTDEGPITDTYMRHSASMGQIICTAHYLIVLAAFGAVD